VLETRPVPHQGGSGWPSGGSDQIRSLPALTAFNFFLQFAFWLIRELGFALAQLAGDFLGGFIYGSIQISISFFGVNVRAGNGEVDFNAESLLRIAFFVLKENHVGGNDAVSEFFQMTYLVSDIRVERRRQREVPWTEMYLHRKYLTVFLNGCQHFSLV